MITQQEIKGILKKSGDIRGVAFHSITNYILSQKGEEGIKKVENKMKSWGVNFSHKTIKNMSWYPISWGAVFVLATQDVFGWGDAEIRKMGEDAPKSSILVKLFFKLFPSIEKLAEQIPVFWRKNYTVGEVEVASFDLEKKRIILKLKDCSFHHLLCKYVEGFSQTAFQFAAPKGSQITVQETKCSLKDEVPYEEYLVTWT